MGSEAFNEQLRRRDRCDISLLVLPEREIKKAFAKYENAEGLKIVWGTYTTSCLWRRRSPGATTCSTSQPSCLQWPTSCPRIARRLITTIPRIYWQQSRSGPRWEKM